MEKKEYQIEIVFKEKIKEMKKQEIIYFGLRQCFSVMLPLIGLT